MPSSEQCLEQASTGQGVWDVAVATNRLLWLTYAGGNIREWALWTAMTTRKSPWQVRFVARDVDDPPPIVIGPATVDADRAQGVAWSVGRVLRWRGARR